MDRMKGLLALLGEDNVEMVRRRVAELIVRNVEEQLSEEWLLGDRAGEVGDFLDKVFEECLEEARGRIKEIAKGMLSDSLSALEAK